MYLSAVICAREMKKIRYILVLAALLLPLGLSAQSACFWTEAADLVPIRIYIDREYLGDVTEAFGQQPALDAPGALSLDLTPGRHEFTAVDKYGRVYKGSDVIRARENEIYFQQLRGWRFREVNRADYAFVFLDWLPVFGPYPYRYPRLHIEDLSPLEDQGLLIGMATAAVGATAAMGIAASKNWDTPDSRFPYVALGFDSEYFSTLEEWRNVARLRARFGAKGGFSLLADAGLAAFPGYYWNTAFTFSLGAGLDYDAFSFSLRYKPPVGRSSDTFLLARAEYDWWLDQRFALDFHLGFGVGGFGPEGLFDYYEFPIGFGFLVKL